MKSAAVLLTLGLMLGASFGSKAEVVTFSVRGQFSTSLNPDIGNLPPETYPYPRLFGGSFEGSFSFDTEAQATVYEENEYARFDYLSVKITIRDGDAAPVHTIDSGPNQFAVFRDGAIQLNFGASDGPEAVHKPEDLRLVLTSPSLAVSPLPPAADTIADASFAYGFSEVDGPHPFTYWNLDVLTASITVVPEPSTVAMHGLGMLTLAYGAKRRAARSEREKTPRVVGE